MKTIKFILIVFTALLFSDRIPGQVGISKLGQSTMNFLLVGTSARAGSMGEAYITLGKGAESIFYNPSGIAETKKDFDLILNYTQWIADIKYLSGAAVYNMGNMGAVGLSFLTVDYGTINATRLDPSQISVTGNVVGYIDDGPLGNVGAYSFGLSYAKSISTKFLIGGTMKLVGQNLGQNNYGNDVIKKNNAVKLAFDAGVKYFTEWNHFSFGMAIRNFASNIRREQQDEQLPLTFTMGGTISLTDFFNPALSETHNINLAVDFLHSNSYSERINIGAEYLYMKLISLRAGYQTNRDIASWSAGLGVVTTLSDYDVEVSYSFSKMNTFDGVSRISVNIGF